MRPVLPSRTMTSNRSAGASAQPRGGGGEIGIGRGLLLDPDAHLHVPTRPSLAASSERLPMLKLDLLPLLLVGL